MKKTGVLYLFIILSVVFGSILTSSTDSAAKDEDRPIQVFVYGQVSPDVVRVGSEIPLTVTILNEMDVPVHYPTFSLEPNDWNGETSNIALVDIYRNSKMWNLYLDSPDVNVPRDISGQGHHRIDPGNSLTIRTDARKWTLRDSWLPGRYQVTLRVNVTVGKHYLLSILSDPFEFEIK